MRKVIFKLTGTNAKGDWFMVKLSGYFDAKNMTWHEGKAVFDEGMYNAVNEGDIIKVV